MNLEQTTQQPDQQRKTVLQSPSLEMPPATTTTTTMTSATATPAKSHWWVWLIVLAGLVLLCGAGYFVWARIQAAAAATAAASKGAKPPVPVQYAVARKGSFDIYLDGLGVVTALNTVSIHTRVDGQLLSVLYKEGEMVAKDQLLIEIDPRPFEDTLVQAQGALIRDQALLGDAKVNLVRYQDLYNQGLSVPKSQVDTQAALVKQYEGAVKIDQGQIQSSETNIVYCKVTAPFAGRIGLRLVDQGNIVHAADVNPVAVITQIEPITVIFTIAEDDINTVMRQLRPGQSLKVEAWDRTIEHKLATGKLLAIDNQVDTTTGMLRLRAVFPNGPRKLFHFPFFNKLVYRWTGEQMLFPNQFVNARLLVDTLENVIRVDSAAIQRGPGFLFVYVIKSDSTVEMRKVEIGPTEGKKTVVNNGFLADGERVVTDGVDKLVDAAKVNPTREKGTGGPGKEKGARPKASATTAPGDNASPTKEHKHHHNESDTPSEKGGAE